MSYSSYASKQSGVDSEKHTFEKSCSSALQRLLSLDSRRNMHESTMCLSEGETECREEMDVSESAESIHTLALSLCALSSHPLRMHSSASIKLGTRED